MSVLLVCLLGGLYSAPALSEGAAGAPAEPPPLPSLPAVPAPVLAQDAPRPTGREPIVLQLVIDGAITQVTADMFEQALAEAEARRAQALVLSIDTPGGLLDATRQIVQRILEAPLPVLGYVAPAGARAASAGTFLILASHVAAMHPTSSLGAAHPVGPFGQDIQGSMKDKVVQDTASWARSLAQSRGRNSDWAERAVLQSSSLTAGEALALGVVDLLAPDLQSLLQQSDGRVVAVRGQAWRVSTRDVRVDRFEPTLRQSAFEALAHPVVVYLLLLAGALGLYVEFAHPGLIVPGLLGALCLALVFGLQVLPMNGLALLLLGVAALLLVAEIYVTSFGLLALAGLTCLVIGSYLLFDVPGSPFRLSPLWIWTTTLVFAAGAGGAGYKIVRVRRRGATSGPEALIGARAEVVAEIAAGGRGKIFFDGAYWDATGSLPLAAGARCRVTALRGLLAVVEPLDPALPAAPASRAREPGAPQH